MFRQFPASRAEKFDMISCSLVVNFGPTAKGRGDMLRRTTQFLVEPPSTLRSSLFSVLPLVCESNSRYFSQALLREIMDADAEKLNIRTRQSFKISGRKICQ